MKLPWQPPDDPDLAPFWDAAARGELHAPVCDGCGRAVLHPRPLCPSCHAPTTWRRLSGRGQVHAFGVEHRPVGGAVGLEAPYVIALIELEEGGRLVSNVVDPPAAVSVGAAVEVVFADVDGRAVPRFRLASAGGTA